MRVKSGAWRGDIATAKTLAGIATPPVAARTFERPCGVQR